MVPWQIVHNRDHIVGWLAMADQSSMEYKSSDSLVVITWPKGKLGEQPSVSRALSHRGLRVRVYVSCLRCAICFGYVHYVVIGLLFF